MSYAADNADFGQAEIVSALPDDARAALSENNISPDNGGITAITAEGAVSALWNTFRKEITKPLRLFFALSGVILLSALCGTLKKDDNSALTAVFDIVCIAAGVIIIAKEMSAVIIRNEETLKSGTVFLLTFCPVFAGILAATGAMTTAGVFNSLFLAAVQLFSGFINIILNPLSVSMLGLGAAGAINPDFRIEKLASAIQKAIEIALGFLLILFIGLLSLQTAVTASADDLTIKTGKYIVSNSVPIIGGAVSDALSTVKGSLSLLKNTAGTFGIVAAISILAPSIIAAACYKTALSLAASVGDLFGISPLSGVIRTAESVVTIMLAFLSAFALFAVMSIGVLIAFSSGGTP
jgi:stage III sporulation protein AE